jgi:hypothetical protein
MSAGSGASNTSGLARVTGCAATEADGACRHWRPGCWRTGRQTRRAGAHASGRRGRRPASGRSTSCARGSGACARSSAGSARGRSRGSARAPRSTSTTRGRPRSTTVMRSGLCFGSVAIGRSIQSLWKRGSPCTRQRYSFWTSRSFHCARSELHRRLGLADHHHAGGVAVEPVHDARAVRRRRRRQVAEARPRPAGDRVRPDHRCWVLRRVRREAGRLVDRAQPRVVVQHHGPPAAAGRAPAGRGQGLAMTSSVEPPFGRVSR